MKPQLKTLAWSDFDQHRPCYSPQETYGDFSGTILDILKDERIPNAHKTWAFTRKGIMDDKTLRLFAVRCGRQVQHLMEDERSINALDVAERYANGLATREELAKAREAAWEAREAAGEAAWEAAWEAAGAARAARAAVKAALAERWSAREADEAWEAAEAAQIQIAIELIKEFYTTTN